MGATAAFLQVATADTGNLSSYSFASQNIGTAAADRLIICAVHSASSTTAARNISTLTIGGVTATKIAEVTGSSTNLTLTALWMAIVPTGTTGTVAVTFNNTMQRCQIALYRLTGMNTTVYQTLTVTTNNQNNSIFYPDRAFIVGAATVNANATCTWANITENYDATMETNASSHSGAHSAFFTPPAASNMNANFTTGTEFSAVFASLGEQQSGGLMTLGVGA